jgi:hypothetical protein
MMAIQAGAVSEMSFKYPSLRTTPPKVGYYARLDAGSSVDDQFTSDGAQNGTLTNGADRTDNDGLAYRFVAASSQFIQVAAIAMPTDALTVAAWLNIAGVRATLFSFAALDSASRVWNVGTDGSRRPYFQIPLASSYWFTSGSGTAIPQNTWTHLAFTADRASATARLYVDGTDVTPTISGASTNDWRSPIGNPTIARSLGFYSDTLIDDWILYNNVALSASAIADLASQRGAIYALNATSRRRRELLGGLL